MTIKDFIKTEVGKEFKEVLKGCNKSWQVEYYEEIGDLHEELKANGWLDSDIEDHIDLLDFYKVSDDRKDFVIVIN